MISSSYEPWEECKDEQEEMDHCGQESTGEGPRDGAPPPDTTTPKKDISLPHCRSSKSLPGHLFSPLPPPTQKKP